MRCPTRSGRQITRKRLFDERLWREYCLRYLTEDSGWVRRGREGGEGAVGAVLGSEDASVRGVNVVASLRAVPLSVYS